MSEETSKNTEKSIQDELHEVLSKLSFDQLRFVAAMQHSATKREAAKACDLKENTVYGWPALVDEAVRLAALEREEAAREIGRKHLAKAMMVKVSGLDSEDERVRQSVASELIEWNLGKAMQKQEVTGPNGEVIPIAVQFIPYARTDPDHS